MTNNNSPWGNYPPDYQPPAEERDTEPYRPVPLVTSAILGASIAVFGLAVWKLAELLGAVYQWSIG
ncbi:MAG TPA: hypothetical protein PKD55_19665 [Bellilinea sp.]|nr:hypothetical protein [Bellilinea sp.]